MKLPLSHWMFFLTVSVAAGAYFGVVNSVYAANANWNVNADGLWTTNANWNPNSTHPDSGGQIAGLTNNIGAARVVTLDAAQTIGTLNIGDSTSSFFGFTLSGANILTFDNSGSGVTIAKTVTANTATDVIDVPITLKGALTINNTATAGAISISGAIGNDGTNRAVTVTGTTGSAIVTFSTANTYGGTTTVTTGGRLRITNSSALGPGNIVVGGGTATPRLELAGGITLNNDFTSLGGSDTNPTTAPRIASFSGNNTMAGDMLGVTTGGGNYPIHSMGTDPGDFFTISGDIINSRNVAADNRNLRLGGAGDGEVTGLIRETALSIWHLFKDGAGTWILSGNNTYSGTTTVNSGLLSIGNDGATGSLGAGNVILNDASANNGGLVFNRANTMTVANAISGTGNIHQANPSDGTTILSNANTYAGYTHIYQGRLQVTNGGALGGANTGAGGNGSGGFSEIYFGNLAMDNNVTSAEVLYLVVPHDSNDAETAHIYSLASTSNELTGVISTDSPDGFSVPIDGTNKYFTVQSNTGSNLKLSGNIRQDAVGSAILTLRGSGNGEVSGNIVEPVTKFFSNTGVSGNIWNLDKEGSGLWILSGNNTYTGTTFIGNGTLLVNGSLSAASTVTVANGATLGGAGTIGGSVIVDGTYASGNSIGQQDLGALTIAADGTWEVEYNGSGSPAIDLTDVSGMISLADDATISFVPLGGALTDVAYIFASYGSFSGNLSEISLLGVPDGYLVNYGYNGNNIALVQVPEPVSFFIAAMAFSGLAIVAVKSERRGRLWALKRNFVAEETIDTTVAVCPVKIYARLDGIWWR